MPSEEQQLSESKTTTPQVVEAGFVADFIRQNKPIEVVVDALSRTSRSRLVEHELEEFKHTVRSGDARILDPDDRGFADRPDAFNNPERQAIGSITRELCDSQKFPQLLFFTEYGNQLPTPGDVKSDLDVRCIYVGTLSAADRNKVTQQILQSMDERVRFHRPIEVHFQGLFEYLNGVVGEDGDVTVAESINPTLEVQSQRIEHSGLVALYTYMTTRMLSHSVQEVEVLIRKTLRLRERTPLQIRPTEIAERIVIERGDAVDWMHIFFASFIRSNFSDAEIKGRGDWVSRAKRLSKAVIRIGLAKVFASIPEEARPKAKQDLTQLLYQANLPPEKIFMAFIKKYGDTSLSESVITLLKQAELLRTDPTYILDKPITAPLVGNPQFSMSNDFDASIWKGFCAKCELLIFNWASTAGIEFRRSAEDIYDSNATGRALVHVLEMLQHHFEFTKERIAEGSVLIQEGILDDYLYIIPPAQPGNSQGEFEIRFHEPGGSPRSLRRQYSLSIGEIAALLKSRRTAMVLALDAVTVYKLSGESVRTVLQYPFIKEHFLSKLQAGEGTDILLQYLAEYFLRYFTFEFIATVRDRSPGTSGQAITCKESPSEIADSEKNSMHQWFIPDYGKTVLQALESKSIPFERIEITDDETVLFAAGEENDGLYIVLETGGADPPVVLDSFTGNPSARVELEKNGVLGDGALLGIGKRTATATARRGVTLLKISVDNFFTLTGFEGAVLDVDGSSLDAQTSYKGLLFHLFALNLFRARRDIVDSKQAVANT